MTSAPLRPALWLLLAMASTGASGAPLHVDDVDVAFHGRGPAGFKLVGRTGKLTVHDDGKALKFTVPLETLKTGIELRDRHMREKYLKTASFPTATLRVKRADVQLPGADGQTTRGTATGQLTLHGVTRAQPFSYVVNRAGGTQRVTAQMKINFKEHGVSIPSYLGITVKPDIEIKVAFTAR